MKRKFIVDRDRERKQINEKFIYNRITGRSPFRQKQESLLMYTSHSTLNISTNKGHAPETYIGRTTQIEAMSLKQRTCPLNRGNSPQTEAMSLRNYVVKKRQRPVPEADTRPLTKGGGMLN